MKAKPKTYDQSKYENKLQYMHAVDSNTVYFEHYFGAYKLEARIVFNDNHDWPHVMSIHGALSDYTRADPVTLGLQERGISVLGITISGHSAISPLEPERTSMAQNIAEAEAFFGYLANDQPRTVIAYSLGGTPALKLLKKHSDEINRLVLFYPGIYSKDAYEKHYGEPFRSVISKPFSYRDNDTLSLLKQFKGKTLLIKGQYDGLDPLEYGKPAGTLAGKIDIDGEEYYSPIPKEVFDMVFATIPETKRTYIEVPGCDHSVTDWMRTHHNQAAALVAKTADFIH